MSDAILAAVFHDGDPVPRMQYLATATLRPDEVVVKLAGCGICHADIVARDGKIPMRRPVVLGHEGSGYVERVGEGVTSVTVGDPVVLTGMTCGRCRSCLDGQPFNCWQKLPANFSGRRLDGSTALSGPEGEVGAHFFGQSSFSTFSVANERNVVKVRADAPIELLGPLGCGIQTGAGAVLNLLKPRAGQSIVIFGGGGVGLSAVMAAVIAECGAIVVIEPHASRRDKARELGATHVIDPAQESDLVAAILDLTEGGADKALDTSGRLDMMTAAWRSLANGGALVLVGSAIRDAALPVPVLDLVNRGITIHGGASGNLDARQFIPHLVDLYMDGRFPFDRLIVQYPFADLERAIDDHVNGSAIKPVVLM